MNRSPQITELPSWHIDSYSSVIVTVVTINNTECWILLYGFFYLITQTLTVKYFFLIKAMFYIKMV